MNIRPPILLVALIALTGCSASIDMPTDWAKLNSGGYVNSGGNYDLGHLFIWDTQTNSVTKIDKIGTTPLEGVTIDEGSVYSNYASTLSKDTEIDVSANTALSSQITAEAKAKFLNSTNVTLTNFNIKEFRDPSYALNSPALRPWRVQMYAENPQYASPRYRFIFISGVSVGDKIDIAFKHDNNVTTTANIIKIGQFAFDVTYDDDTEATLTAKNQAPLIITPTVFTFEADASKTPLGLQFVQDLNSGFNFQKYHP